jgi:hypothetical protein
LAQLNNPTLELHQRILADLDHRDLGVGEKESEARRLFEQVIAQCSAERAAIASERKVLTQAEELYIRFLAAHETIRPEGPLEDSALLAAGNPDSADFELEPDAPPRVDLVTEGTELEPSDRTSDIEVKMRELRSGLAEEVAKENASEQKPTRWSSPIRALLGPGS